MGSATVKFRVRVTVMVLGVFMIFEFTVLDLRFNINGLVLKVWVMGFWPWCLMYMVRLGLKLISR